MLKYLILGLLLVGCSFTKPIEQKSQNPRTVIAENPWKVFEHGYRSGIFRDTVLVSIQNVFGDYIMFECKIVVRNKDSFKLYFMDGRYLVIDKKEMARICVDNRQKIKCESFYRELE